MNETLEAMARALFKSWFVDFDPVRAKAEGRQPSGMDAETAKLFPSEFVESDLGRIPKGWRMGCLDELASSASSAITAGPFGSKLVRSDYVETGVPVIRGQNLGSSPGEWFNEGEFVYVTPSKVEQDLSSCIARPGDVVFTQRGTLGQIGMIPQDAQYERYVVSQSQMKMTCADEVPPEYIVLSFKQAETIDYIKSNSVAAGVPHINLGFLRKFPILVPTRPVLGVFGDRVRPIQRQMRSNILMSRSLAMLRDILLPKLLSGEVTAPRGERSMEGSE